MPDVEVTSAVENDISEFTAGLKAAMAEFDAFASRVNSTDIAPNVAINTTALAQAWQQALAQMQKDAQSAAAQASASLSGINATVNIQANLTQAQAQLQAWLASIGTVNLNFSAPSATMIGTDIGNAAAAAFQAAVAGMTWPGGGGGGSGDGGGGGGGTGSGGGGRRAGGRNTIGGLPIGRGLTAMMAMHQMIRWGEVEGEYSERIKDAGGDESKLLEANIRHRTDHDSAFFGLGRVGRFARENTWDRLTGSETVESAQDTLRTLKKDEKAAEAAKGEQEFVRGIDENFQEKTGQTAHDRQRIGEKLRAEKEQRKISAHYDEEKGKIDKEYKQTLAEADLIDSSLGWSATPDQKGVAGFLFGDFTVESDSHRAQGMRDEADVIQEGKKRRLEAIEAKEQEKQRIADKAEADRLKAAADLEDAQAVARGEVAQLRASGDVEGAHRREVKMRLDAEQFHADQQSPEQGKTFREQTRPAEEKFQEAKIAEREELSRFHAHRELTDIEAKAEAATQRARGDSRGADDSEYRRGLKEEIEEQLELAKVNKETNKTLSEQAAAKAAMLQLKMPEKIAAREETHRREDALRDVHTRSRVEDIAAEAREATQRALGDVRGAAESSLSRHIDERVTKLRADAADAKDPREASRLLEEAATEEANKAQRMNALRIANTRDDEREISDIRAHAQEYRLKEAGAYYQADLDQLNHSYDQRIKKEKEAGRGNVAAELEGERAAAVAQHEKQHARKVEDLQQEAKEQELRNKGFRKEAEVEKITHRATIELEQATGDPAMQKAIFRKEQADLEALRKGQMEHPSDLRDAWFKLQAGVLDGGNAKVVRDAQAAAKKQEEELDKDPFKPPVPPSRTQPPPQQFDPMPLQPLAPLPNAMGPLPPPPKPQRLREPVLGMDDLPMSEDALAEFRQYRPPEVLPTTPPLQPISGGAIIPAPPQSAPAPLPAQQPVPPPRISADAARKQAGDEAMASPLYEQMRKAKPGSTQFKEAKDKLDSMSNRRFSELSGERLPLEEARRQAADEMMKSPLYDQMRKESPASDHFKEHKAELERIARARTAELNRPVSRTPTPTALGPPAPTEYEKPQAGDSKLPQPAPSATPSAVERPAIPIQRSGFLQRLGVTSAPPVLPQLSALDRPMPRAHRQPSPRDDQPAWERDRDGLSASQRKYFESHKQYLSDDQRAVWMKKHGTPQRDSEQRDPAKGPWGYLHRQADSTPEPLDPSKGPHGYMHRQPGRKTATQELEDLRKNHGLSEDLLQNMRRPDVGKGLEGAYPQGARDMQSTMQDMAAKTLKEAADKLNTAVDKLLAAPSLSVVDMA